MLPRYLNQRRFLKVGSIHKLGSRGARATALALLLNCLFATTTFAAGMIQVTTTDDEFGTGGNCSLREAIESANTDSDFGGCLRINDITPPYTINFVGAGNYTLSLAGANNDDNATGDLDIRAAMTIDGANLLAPVVVEGGLTRDAGIDRVFHVVADDLEVTFNELTIRHGRVLTETGDNGGGIANSSSSTVTVWSSVIISNAALGDAANEGGGGLFNDLGGTLIISDTMISENEATTGSGSGGGILTRAGSPLIVVGSTLTNNRAARAGGGIESNASAVTLTDVDLLENSTGLTPGNGGGLHSTGASTVTVSAGVVMSNVAAAEGGGLWNSISGTMTILGVNIAGNIASGAAADQGGGGLFNDGGNLTVRASTLRNNMADGAAGSGGGILNSAGGALTVESTLIEGNRSVRAGGGIEDNASETLLVDVDLIGNVTGGAPGNGGGFHSTGASLVTIRAAMVMSNTASAEGGGLWNSAFSIMTVDKSVIAYNSADGSEATNGGGGLFNVGGLVTVDNSTIGENNAATNGGAAKLLGGAISFTNVTLFNNHAAGDASALDAANGTLTLRNSIVAAVDGDKPLCMGGINDMDAPNLASDSSCGASIVDDAFLGPLQNNGGSTLTYTLLPQSKAIDGGDGVICFAATINNLDQRAFTRLQGVQCDLGAYESNLFSQHFHLWLFWIGKDKQFGIP